MVDFSSILSKLTGLDALKNGSSAFKGLSEIAAKAATSSPTDPANKATQTSAAGLPPKKNLNESKLDTPGPAPVGPAPIDDLGSPVPAPHLEASPFIPRQITGADLNQSLNQIHSEITNNQNVINRNVLNLANYVKDSNNLFDTKLVKVNQKVTNLERQFQSLDANFRKMERDKNVLHNVKPELAPTVPGQGAGTSGGGLLGSLASIAGLSAGFAGLTTLLGALPELAAGGVALYELIKHGKKVQDDLNWLNKEAQELGKKGHEEFEKYSKKVEEWTLTGIKDFKNFQNWLGDEGDKIKAYIEKEGGSIESYILNKKNEITSYLSKESKKASDWIKNEKKTLYQDFQTAKSWVINHLPGEKSIAQDWKNAKSWTEDEYQGAKAWVENHIPGLSSTDKPPKVSAPPKPSNTSSSSIWSSMYSDVFGSANTSPTPQLPPAPPNTSKVENYLTASGLGSDTLSSDYTPGSLPPANYTDPSLDPTSLLQEMQNISSNGFKPSDAAATGPQYTPSVEDIVEGGGPGADYLTGGAGPKGGINATGVVGIDNAPQVVPQDNAATTQTQTTRTWNIPSIPSGMGGAVLTQLKSAGVNVPTSLAKKIQSGQQITQSDLQALPQADLDKTSKLLQGYGMAPLYVDTTRPKGGPIAQGKDSTGKVIGSKLQSQLVAMAKAGDRQGIRQALAAHGYHGDSADCAEFAQAVAEGGGIAGMPKSSYTMASNWQNWGTVASGEDVNAKDGRLGEFMAVSKVHTYGAGRGAPLYPGQQGGHIMPVVPGSYNPKTGMVQVYSPDPARETWIKAYGGEYMIRRGHPLGQQQSSSDDIDQSISGGAVGGGVGKDSGVQASSRKWSDISQAMMSRLKSHYGLTDAQAAAIVGNAAEESNKGRSIQEINPIGGGRGGLGLIQWTGARRVAFENWLKQNHKSANDPNANIDYLMHEIDTHPQYKKMINNLKQYKDVGSATDYWMHHFESPNPRYAHEGERIQEAEAADKLATSSKQVKVADAAISSKDVGVQEKQHPVKVTPQTNVAHKNIRYNIHGKPATLQEITAGPHPSGATTTEHPSVKPTPGSQTKTAPQSPGPHATQAADGSIMLPPITVHAKPIPKPKPKQQVSVAPPPKKPEAKRDNTPKHTEPTHQTITNYPNRGPSIPSVTHNPEQRDPSPGNWGAGQTKDPDGVGICSV